MCGDCGVAILLWDLGIPRAYTGSIEFSKQAPQQHRCEVGVRWVLLMNGEEEFEVREPLPKVR
jgi:hypothetical protein